MPQVDYAALAQSFSTFVAPERIYTDPLRTLAYGTDASFYRLTPKIVVVAEDEAEVLGLVALCRGQEAPVTFRAAGTSLSGQAVTDSVLIVLGEGFDGFGYDEERQVARLGPSLVGGEANRRLLPFKRKIGPDPASIATAKIGGIAANNASGMCCGVGQNSYHTLQSMRLILADGAVLDTADPADVARFRETHGALLDGLAALSAEIRADAMLFARIKEKYRRKNTTGYAINALIDFSDPVDMLTHLMIGSEGTLGFLSRVDYRTVPEYADKASAFVVFADLEKACRAVTALKTTPVEAVELLDRASLESVKTKKGMPVDVDALGPDASALLIEARAPDAADLAVRIAAIVAAIDADSTLNGVAFSHDPVQTARYWDIRKGTFPAVGGKRPAGTTVIIEDVAFPVERLAEATMDLRALLNAHGYTEAIIFGHALEGNLHFVFAQGFDSPDEVKRYAGFMEAVAELVVGKYDGSLKAEHGTGRNMAPFVEREWGRAATDVMRRVKKLLDPQNLFNPGVVLNDDPEAHLKNLKPHAGGVAADRRLHRMRVLRAAMPLQRPDPVAAPAHHGVAGNPAAALRLPKRARTRGDGAGLPLFRRHHLRGLFAVFDRLPAGDRRRPLYAQLARAAARSRRKTGGVHGGAQFRRCDQGGPRRPRRWRGGGRSGRSDRHENPVGRRQQGFGDAEMV